ncbi:MAG TPA: hypothetical protein VL972_02390 [Solirubrobacteraceae bacterium]|nr:hypothetical protein [Solirubrobacteraceae bacterium]
MILADVPFVKWERGKAKLDSKGRGIITSHGCACEDYERAARRSERSSQADRVMLQVAPLKPAKVFGEKLELIRSGSHLDFFFVEGDGSIADQVVDLTREQGLPASVLAECKRSGQIADWQWKALLVHVAVSRFHQTPEKLFLPELLESRSDAA